MPEKIFTAPGRRRGAGSSVPTGARAPSRGRWAKPAGFTLLEIAVVLFIIALVASMVLPRMGAMRDMHLKSESRRLAGRATYLYSRAMSDKALYRLTFDMDGDSYSVSRLDPYAAQPVFMPDREPGFAPVLMPAGVRLRDVTVAGFGTVNRGTANCFFYPEGFVDATVVHLIDDSGSIFTLSFNPVTGRVAIASGDIAPKSALAM